MRSFAVIGFAAAANAAAYGYPTVNTTSVAPPTYPAVSSPAGYPVSVVSSAPVYKTTVVTGLSTVCGPTTLSVGTKTYTVTKSTTIVDKDCVYTTSYPAVKPTPEPVKPSSAVPNKPSAPPVVVPYPTNGTAPAPPAGTAPPAAPPASTKPAPPQFTGAAAQTGAALMAIVGAVAAFL